MSWSCAARQWQAMPLVAGVLAVTFLMGAHSEIAEPAGRAAARLARQVRKSIDPEAAGWRR